MLLRPLLSAAVLLSLSAQAQVPSPRGTAAAPAQVEAGASRVTYIRAGRLFDGTGDDYRKDVTIVVEGERIREVVPTAQARPPAGARVVDLSHATVLPGLMDAHVHLTSRPELREEINTFRRTGFNAAFAAVVNARKTLLAGFTTVRDLGGPPFLVLDLRRDIDSGYLEGPRIVAAGPGIHMTGGHGDLNNYPPHVQVTPEPQRALSTADGEDEVRKAVRTQVRHGVDAIKVMSTGGVFSRGTQPGAPQYTVEELRAAADEAHKAGRRIAAHAHGAEGIKNAIRAGVDSVEHASLIDEEGLKLAKERGTYLVMDIYNSDWTQAKAREFRIPEEFVRKDREIAQAQRDNFRRAVRAGVKVAYGTDAGVHPNGENGKQFATQVAYGQTPAQAIRSATSVAAELLGVAKDTGTVAPGKYADLIAVEGDPLRDVRELEDVDWVMKGGVVYKPLQRGGVAASE